MAGQVSELSLSCNVIIFQFVVTHSAGIGFDYYGGSALPTILLWLLSLGGRTSFLVGSNLFC